MLIPCSETVIAVPVTGSADTVADGIGLAEIPLPDAVAEGCGAAVSVLSEGVTEGSGLAVLMLSVGAMEGFGLVVSAFSVGVTEGCGLVVSVLSVGVTEGFGVAVSTLSEGVLEGFGVAVSTLPAAVAEGVGLTVIPPFDTVRDTSGLEVGDGVTGTFGVLITLSVFFMVTRITAVFLPAVALILQLPAFFAVIVAFFAVNFLTVAIFLLEDFHVTDLFAFTVFVAPTFIDSLLLDKVSFVAASALVIGEKADKVSDKSKTFAIDFFIFDFLSCLNLG